MKVTPMELAALRRLVTIFTIFVLLLLSAGAHSTAAGFSPHQGDYFRYSETTDLGNGTGNYAGYTEHQTVNGSEKVTGVSGTTVSMNYAYTYDWSNSSGATKTGASSGLYTFSSSTFLYVNGTDNETSFGSISYVNPSVWFAMNNSLPVGANFTMLNTQMKILATNATVFVPTQNETVRAIIAYGSGSYERNDSYGKFNAGYTWTAWFDPSTGYIIGYNYYEWDTNSDGDGFSYVDNLYVTNSSYALTVTTTTPPGTTTLGPPVVTTVNLPSTTSSTSSSSSQTPLLEYAVIVVVVVIVIAVAAFAFLRGRKPPTITGTQS